MQIENGNESRYFGNNLLIVMGFSKLRITEQNVELEGFPNFSI